MKLFERKKNEKYTIIVGCGRLGSKIANTVSDKGGNVLVVDKSGNSFRRLSSGFGGLTVVGDCTDVEVLKEAQIDKASAVIAVTNDDNVNIMVAQLAKNVFKSENVIARLYDPERQWVCNEGDISIICPALLSAREINTLLE